jgi:hypothetical protein
MKDTSAYQFMLVGQREALLHILRIMYGNTSRVRKRRYCRGQVRRFSSKLWHKRYTHVCNGLL